MLLQQHAVEGVVFWKEGPAFAHAAQRLSQQPCILHAAGQKRAQEAPASLLLLGARTALGIQACPGVIPQELLDVQPREPRPCRAVCGIGRQGVFESLAGAPRIPGRLLNHEAPFMPGLS